MSCGWLPAVYTHVETLVLPQRREWASRSIRRLDAAASLRIAAFYARSRVNQHIYLSRSRLHTAGQLRGRRSADCVIAMWQQSDQELQRKLTLSHRSEANSIVTLQHRWHKLKLCVIEESIARIDAQVHARVRCAPVSRCVINSEAIAGDPNESVDAGTSLEVGLAETHADEKYRESIAGVSVLAQVQVGDVHCKEPGSCARRHREHTDRELGAQAGPAPAAPGIRKPPSLCSDHLRLYPDFASQMDRSMQLCKSGKHQTCREPRCQISA